MASVTLCDICGERIDLGGEYSAPWHNLSITTRYQSGQSFIETNDFCSVKCAKKYLDTWIKEMLKENGQSSKGIDIIKKEGEWVK